MPLAPRRADGSLGGVGDDTLGGVGEGALATDVVKAVGKPTKVTPPTYDMATGEFVSRWDYGAKGITVFMVSRKETGPFHVDHMIAYETSSVKTNKGIGVGASADDVVKAYGAAIDKATSDDGGIGVGAGGDEPDGLGFVLDAKTKKVRYILLGRDWEGSAAIFRARGFVR